MARSPKGTEKYCCSFIFLGLDLYDFLSIVPCSALEVSHPMRGATGAWDTPRTGEQCETMLVENPQSV